MHRASLIRNNVAYAVGSAANSLALFLLIPYLINALSVAEYGAWVLFEVFIMLLVMLVLAGADVGLMRDYWFLEGEEARNRLSGTVLLTMSGWGALVALLGGTFVWLGGGTLGTLGALEELPVLRPALALVLAIGVLEALFSLLLSLLRIREEAILFAMLSFGRMLLFLLAATAGVYLSGSVLGALGGRLLSATLGMGAALWFTRHYLAPAWDFSRLRRVARYGMPLLPANLAGYVLFASDRHMLQLFTSLQLVAIYSFAYKVATTMDVLVTRPFAMDWAPRRFKIATEANPQAHYARILLLYLFASVGFALLVYGSTLPAYVLVAPAAYRDGMGVVPFLLLAYVIFGLGYPLNVGIMLKDETRLLPLINGLAAVVCLGLNWLLIPRWGMWGAAWATIAAYTVQVAGLTLGSLRLYPIAYPLRSIAAIVGVGAVGALLVWMVDRWLGEGALWLGWTLKLSGIGLLWAGLALGLWRGSLQRSGCFVGWRNAGVGG